MKDRLRRWLGLGSESDFVKKYMMSSNTRAITYMAVIVLVISFFTLVKLFVDYFQGNTIETTEFVMKLLLHIILLVTCGLSVVYAGRTLKDFRNNIGELSYSTILIFSAVCILYGFFTSLLDYGTSGHVMVFIALEILVVCMLAWRPYISILIVAVSFTALYLLILLGGAGSGKTPGAAFATGYFIAGITIIVTSIAAYAQKKTEALKEESLEKTNNHLAETAVKDELTGTANMGFFIKRAREILKDPEIQYQRMRFVYLDVENFSPINEKYGFEAGNSFLRKFAGQVVDVFYDGLVGHQGDDHFVVLCDRKDLEQRITALRKYIYDLGLDTRTGLKAGGYPVKSRGEDPSGACDKARYACASIKKLYDQDYCEYDDALDEQFNMRQYIINYVDAAIDRGDIKVYYQPVCWARNRKLCGYEALTKWEDSEKGMIPTPVFIPVLEEYHQVHKVDMVVVETVCRDLRWLMDNGRPAVPVSLNFSRLDFELTDVVGLLEETTSRYNISPDMIHVEVTESALSDNLESLHRDLDNIKAMGFPLWLDDFGSGYSSLNVLKDFDFDVMKIDMVFLSSFYDKPDTTRAVLKNVVNMAEDLGMHTLTEGVETIDEAEYLKSIGCERLQGYLFGKPMPLKEALVKITAGTLPVSEEYI